jgi:hypothetical protein
MFQLEFHLQFFAFRTSPPSNDNPLSEWTDLAFLEMQDPKPLDQRRHGMLEAQFSFVICGCDETRWVAWAFDDTQFDGEDLSDRISPCKDVHQDPIADDDTDPELPIWSPREYFLNVVERRIARAAMEWEETVRPVERSIREYVRENDKFANCLRCMVWHN